MKKLAFLGLLLFCVPGYAEQWAVASKNGDVLELHDRIHGKCPPGINEAVYILAPSKGGQRIDGCWMYLPDRDLIALVFEDGDQGAVPTRLFTWVRGKKPATM